MLQPFCQSAYANQISIIQSSGTGKSRTVDELAKRLFSFPFNLREAPNIEGELVQRQLLVRLANDKITPGDTSYPPPDTSIREYFTTKEVGTVERLHQAARYACFFRVLFDEARAQFCPDVKKAQDLRQRLVIERPERQNFYEEVVNKAKDSRNDEQKKKKEVRIICNTRTPVD